MDRKTSCTLTGAALLSLFAAPAFADDCAPVVASMNAAAKASYKSAITHPDQDGKIVTSRMIQTPTAKYVETNGKWVSMPSSGQAQIDALNETLKTAKMICRPSGTEPVNGQNATIYMVHIESNGTVSDSKLWLSAQNLPLKSEINVGGKQYVSEYDYKDVQPPAGATPLGTK